MTGILPSALVAWVPWRVLSTRIMPDWPIYSILLASGQVISANSYQIVLLTGEAGQSARKLYIIAGVYAAASILWWIIVRRFKALFALSLPWLFYGLDFLLLGISSFITGIPQRGIAQDIATAFYAVAASSGALNFSLNFGDESGAPTKLWATHALVITAFAQFYSSALWFWALSWSARSTPLVLWLDILALAMFPKVLSLPSPSPFSCG